jgi:hypothetical protein
LVRVVDIAEMFDAITEYNDVIRQARTSNDPALLEVQPRRHRRTTTRKPT